MTTTSRGRKFTYNIINTQLWERESARALQTIRKVGFLQKLSTIDDVTKYRGITVFLRRYIIVGHFLILWARNTASSEASYKRPGAFLKVVYDEIVIVMRKIEITLTSSQSIFRKALYGLRAVSCPGSFVDFCAIKIVCLFVHLTFFFIYFLTHLLPRLPNSSRIGPFRLQVTGRRRRSNLTSLVCVHFMLWYILLRM